MPPRPRRLEPHEITAGISMEELGPRQNVIPFDLDEPDEGECAACGHRGAYPELMRTILMHDPQTVVRRCVDSVACLRRKAAR